MINESKKNQTRSWEKWRDSGALETIDTAYSRQFAMYQKMVDLKPNKNPIFTAVEQLTEPTEMRAFFDSCVAYYRLNGDSLDVRKNSESVVKTNIGYVVGYHNEQTATRWMNAIDGIKHPIFGRNIPFTNSERVDNTYIN